MVLVEHARPPIVFSRNYPSFLPASIIIMFFRTFIAAAMATFAGTSYLANSEARPIESAFVGISICAPGAGRIMFHIYYYRFLPAGFSWVVLVTAFRDCLENRGFRPLRWPKVVARARDEHSADNSTEEDIVDA